MDKGPDNLLHLYASGHWEQLSSSLEQIISRSAEEGDEVGLARALCYYGIIQLYLANYHLLSTIQKQILDEYARKPEDIRITASYARFLALYHVFMEQPDWATRYYEEAFRCYEELDWYADEAIMIFESIYWKDLFCNERVILHKRLERLKVLNEKLNGWLEAELTFLESCMQMIRADTTAGHPWPYRVEAGTDHMKKLFAKQSESPLRNGRLPQLIMEHPRLFLLVVGCVDLLAAMMTKTRKVTKEEIGQFAVWGKRYNIDNQNRHPIAEVVGGFVTLLQQCGEQQWNDMQERIESLLAKLALFRHPWYRACTHLLYGLFMKRGSETTRFRIHLQEAEKLFAVFSGVHVSRQMPQQEKASDDQPVRFSFSLFDRFSMEAGGKRMSLESWGTRQARELLLYLMIQPQWQATKDVVMEVFFSGDDTKKSANRLYVTVHRINRTLQESFQLPQQKPLVHIQQGIVQLEQEMMEEVDVHTYRKLLSVANQLWVNDQEAAAELMVKACSMYSPEFVPGVLYLDWLDQLREEVHNLQSRALSRLAEFYKMKGEHFACEEAFMELLRLQPLHEGYYERYIRYLASLNRKAEASHWYQKLERELDRELGVSPSFEWKDLLV
jgi:two-component SAPR family response regulator